MNGRSQPDDFVCHRVGEPRTGQHSGRTAAGTAPLTSGCPGEWWLWRLASGGPGERVPWGGVAGSRRRVV